MNYKVLIFGPTGMIGHTLYSAINKHFNIYYVTKNSKKIIDNFNIFNLEKGFFEIDYMNLDMIKNIIQKIKPDFVINSAGITKKLCTKDNIKNVEYINSTFPNFLDKFSIQFKYKLIHLSTDCVFSGNMGNYKIGDITDAEDSYGISKINGEIINSNVLILRKSTIGLELNTKHGLIEWFLSQKKSIFGFKNVFFTGLTTSELAKTIIFIIRKYPNLNGIYHIGSEKISKYDLLKKLSLMIENFDIDIVPNYDLNCDRSLDSSKFVQITGYDFPNWNIMLKDLSKLINRR